MRLDRKKLAMMAAFSGLVIVGIVVLYLVLLCHPGLLFTHVFKRGTITLYSDELIPHEPAERIIKDVERRLARSPLAAPPRIEDLRVYICNRQLRFALFATWLQTDAMRQAVGRDRV
jgi:hypothetical protein